MDEITGLSTLAIRIQDRSSEQLSNEMLRGRYVERGMGITADLLSRYDGSIAVEPEPGWQKAVVLRFFTVEEGHERREMIGSSSSRTATSTCTNLSTFVARGIRYTQAKSGGRPAPARHPAARPRLPRHALRSHPERGAARRPRRADRPLQRRRRARARFQQDNQGLFVLRALRDAGFLGPVILSYDFSREERRFRALSDKDPALSYCPDYADASEIQAAIFRAVGRRSPDTGASLASARRHEREDLGSPAIRVLMMPRDTNAHGTIFGGHILSLIDQAGAVAAHGTGARKVVTVAVREVVFKAPVHVGDIVSCYAHVIRRGTDLAHRARPRVAEDPVARDCVEVTTAELVYVHVDETAGPTPSPLDDEAP
jgi:acyl-CoA thioesterase YciA